MKDTRIKVQSVGDIITNSSTEVFTIIDEDVIKDIMKVVEVLAGPEYVDKFVYKLDYIEMITERFDEIGQMLIDSGAELEVDPEGDWDFVEPYVYRIIKSVIDEDIIKWHYDHGVPEELKDAEPLDESLAEVIKENIYKCCEDANENHEWKQYPSLMIVPKDPSDKKLVEMAKTLEHLPFIANHEASYC